MELAAAGRVRLPISHIGTGIAMRALDQSEWAIADQPAVNRFVMSFPGGEAFAVYSKLDDYLIVAHTEVPAAFRGRGIGERLVEGIFRLARDRGQHIVPACGFVAEWARRHPEYHDVLAARDGAICFPALSRARRLP